MFKGWKTVIFSVAVMLAGLGEMVDIINIISPETSGLVLLLAGIGTLVLRYLTDTPLGVSEKTETQKSEDTEDFSDLDLKQ